MKTQGWQWHLDGRVLSWRKGNAKRQFHEIYEHSFFVKMHFVLIKKYLNHEMVGVPNEFAPRAQAIAQGLEDVAEFFGLQCKRDDKHRIALWIASARPRGDGKPSTRWHRLTDWRILDCTGASQPKRPALAVAGDLRKSNERFRRLERKSHALMRCVIAVYDNGWLLVPGKTRHSERHKYGKKI